MKIILRLTFLLSLLLSVASQAAEKRVLTTDDFHRFQSVSSPQCSPDGQWIAYTVSYSDLKADERRSAIWMVSLDGAQNVRLTYTAGSDSSPRWSPDGKYLAFRSARPSDAKSQVWLIDRRGGEARQLTDVKQAIEDFEWSPDSKKLVLVMKEVDEQSEKKPKPIVIDRYHFKQDIEGYLTAASRSHLYLFDVQSQKVDELTNDKNYEDNNPVWSPDGKRIAFISNREKDPDKSFTNDVFVIDAKPGSKAEKLISAFAPNEQHLLWSPDGRWIAYLVGSGPQYFAYTQDKLAVIPASGGKQLVLTESLDRMVSEPAFSKDSSFLTFMVADDRIQYPAKIPVTGGTVERLTTEKVVISEQSNCGNSIAVTYSNDSAPPEIYAVETGRLRKLTKHNDDVLAELNLGKVEDINFRSKDGTEIHGLMTKPPSFEKGKKYPTLLWIHGGPNMQDDHSLQVNLYPLQYERQLLAANGYVVLAINYRGSSGYGFDFSRSIFADWGHKEVADLLAGIDEAIRMGVADPQRLGIGGWSYGGILTDYTIATDQRFKAAISGAGSANQLSMYGSDQYALQYNSEIGPPWKKLDTWMHVSYPFFQADKIVTPTLFICGEKDFNVPIAGGEQMYQALRTLGVPTQMVVYPGQFHILTRPSFIT
ncbi:S9 family peptidase, partial [bacterium]|nr:S9 family peptidase [bacterium]